eukprot:XP_017453239.1 PREDICTED: endogenous retrovirus group K member 5 Gag polyprotein-like [Rattus norvegicus]
MDIPLSWDHRFPEDRREKICIATATATHCESDLRKREPLMKKDFTQESRPKNCFSCKQPVHFSRECTAPKAERMPPSSLRPQCKKGRHWTSECPSQRGQELSG